jgi:hypothetical protein
MVKELTGSPLLRAPGAKTANLNAYKRPVLKPLSSTNHFHHLQAPSRFHLALHSPASTLQSPRSGSLFL